MGVKVFYLHKNLLFYGAYFSMKLAYLHEKRRILMVKRIPWEIAVCDWNGTLLDDLELVYGSVKNIFNHFGKTSPSLETYQNEITADFLSFYKRHGIPAGADQELLNSIRKKYFGENGGNVKLSSSAQEFLETLLRLDLKIGIVSGEANGYLQDTRLKQFNVKRYFDFVYDGVSDKAKKFKELLGVFEVNPKTIFYVDDSFDGIAAAKSAGITTFAFIHKGSYNSEKKIMAANPDYVIGNLLEIIPIISN